MRRRYSIGSELEADVILICTLPDMWLNSTKRNIPAHDLAKKEMPPGLWHRVTSHGVRLNPDEVRRAVMDDPRPVCDVPGFENSLNQGVAALEAIWSNHLGNIPESIYIHLTRYGSGGGYHPQNRHMLTATYGPTISVRPDMRQETPLFVTAHETVHLAIEFPIEGMFPGGTPLHELYPIKEAIVDKVLSADEFSVIGGPFKRRDQFVKHLPENWNSLTCFRKALSFNR